MLQLIKRYCWVALLVAGAPAAWGFALWGPPNGETWQTAVIGYNLAGDIGTPRNIGEEYRRNTPILYYTFSQNFSGFYGSNGEAAVVSAFNIMNQVTNVDSYSAALNEYSMETHHADYTALTLGLTDLKSETLTLLAEQVGLAEPERYTWTLHDRYLPSGGKCPFNELYLVVQRNFDPVTSTGQQVQYSPYVNDTLYTYLITEICSGANPLAVTEPFHADPFADQYTAVAGLGVGLGAIPFSISNNLAAVHYEAGGFYTDLTRDDVAGMRYLYSTNNVNWEAPDTGAFWFSITTNVSSPQLFPNYGGTNFVTGTNTLIGYTTNATTSGTNGFNYFYYYDGTYGYGNYSSLVALSKTNSPAVMLALYPGLVIASSSNYFALGSNGVVTTYYTNYTGAQYTAPPVLVTVTNYNPVIIEYYVTKFANVFTNHIWSTNSTAYLQTTTVGPRTGAPITSPSATNVTYQQITYTNVPSGDFFVLPQFYTNYCPLAFQSSTAIITNVLAVTNVLTSASTNITSATNLTTVVYANTLSLITYFTNYIYVVNPVTCAQQTNATTWYQGIGRIQFIQAPDSSLADPLTDTFTTPLTNNYSMVAYNPTNNAFETRNFQRVLVQPDILFSAEDLAAPLWVEPGVGYSLRNLPYNTANKLPNLAGPGTLETPTTISFNKVGSVFENGDLVVNNLSTNEYLTEYTQVGLLGWGSFDGSTNPPVVYPNGTDLANIENQLIIGVTPTPATGLADGTNSVAYTPVSFTATGGVSPYSWSVKSGTTLPSGLTLSASGVFAGTPSGNVAGVYDFTIQLTDAANRVVYFDYSIKIH